ncbi:MAG: hypothetical protein ACREIF_19595, partial [Chthoniobacterales bacterium]
SNLQIAFETILRQLARPEGGGTGGRQKCSRWSVIDIAGRAASALEQATAGFIRGRPKAGSAQSGQCPTVGLKQMKSPNSRQTRQR